MPTTLPLSPSLLPSAPLSRGQRAMWFLWNLHPDGAEYGLPMAWSIRSPFDADVLRAALQDLVMRHPVLRTTYAAERGEPVQRIHAHQDLSFTRIDAAAWSDTQLQARLAQEAHAPFDLANGPVFRVHLFDGRGDGARDPVLLLNCHHIAGDTWSLIVLMEELGQRYAARLAGVDAGVDITAAPAGLPYTDYVAWQADMLAGPVGEAHGAYWRAQLAAPPALDLRTDRPRPPVQRHAGAGHAFELDKALTRQVRALAKQEGVTFYTALLAGFYALLYRYTGQQDLVVGSPRFGRPPEGYAGTVGYFASPCALRAKPEGDMPFAAFLRDVRAVLVGAREHQDFPFPLLVEQLGLARDMSRSPVFQVAFTYQKSHKPAMQGLAAARMGLAGATLDLSGLRLESHPLRQTSVKFDLDFVVEEVDGALRAVCWYDTDLWDGASIAALVGHYKVLLAGAAAAPHTPLDLLPMRAPAEQAAALAWNATGRPFPAATAQRLFEEQALARPQAQALRYLDQVVSFDALNRRANRLAHYLRRAGLEKGQLVGLSMERGPALVTGMLAILKAGGAYLPLDPAYPRERLAYMLEDAGATLLLTQEAVRAALPELPDGARLVSVDAPQDSAAVAAEGEHNPVAWAGPDDLAYIIYTSGSTGRPKGVMLGHRGLSNMAPAMAEAYFIDSDSRVLQFASLSFDASVAEIFTTLCAGATLVMAPKLDLMPGSALVATVRTHAVTTMIVPPSVLALLQPSELPTLRTVVTAGEACPLELARRWADGRRFVNAYGPTEATVCATTELIGTDCERVTIGRPMANVRVHILDRHLRPAPLGVAGELHIGGVGLAWGYLGRPELTREKFIADPLGAPGERLYRSGDLARQLPDGRIEFLGRLDHQVKVRGFRIELGEIEEVVAAHAGVREALVLARQEHGGASLVAYVIPRDGATLAAAELRAHAQERLPDFMLPAAFVTLAAWPLTPNGKIDRKALPAPATAAAPSAGMAPRDALEQQIAAIWREVLGHACGIDDNFFEAGGHSLGLVRIELALEETLGLAVPTMDLFRFPTIRTLAAHLRALGGQDADAQPRATAPATSRARADEDIAIIGMAGRFPGAADVDRFWANLAAGVESVGELGDDQLRAAGVAPDLLADPRYVRRKGVLADVDAFDAPFFGYPPREAQLMDPQQRLFLETGWQALEHAGYDSARFTGRIGVYGGIGRAGYLLHYLDSHPESALEIFETTILNEKDFLSTRLAYKLNLRGPALSVQTACSTSLVAVHLACQQLRDGDCDIALAGGVSIEVPHGAGYLYQEGHILSPDGRCRPFDADARGTVRGSGGAIVVLKRLSEAQADGNTVWAVIKGSAINNDGAVKVGFTAPSVDGQADVIAQALARAGVDAGSIGLVEAHGTATALGDPIEVAALTTAYRRHTQARNYCYLGSAKSNVGHLDAASGVTGLIKAALALHHRLIPATLHFTKPNPKLALETSPFKVNDKAVAWPDGDAPRRAAVSSFGIGGTNAHVILEQAPSVAPARTADGWQMLTLSAKSATALDAMGARLAAHLEGQDAQALADIAWTLQLGRAELAQRRVVVSDSAAGAAEQLRKPAAAVPPDAAPGRAARLVYLFPGQGLQAVHMGRDLYRDEPVFRNCVDDCAAQLQPLLGLDLRTLLYPQPRDEAAAQAQLAQTALTQPALFVIEYALVRLLGAWGLQPQAMMGHSLGEYVAACVAGVMSLPDALKLVAARGRLVQRLPAGAMLAVEAAPAQLDAFLGDGVDLAVINGPRACVMAGPEPAIAAAQERIRAAGLRSKRLDTSHAFHSAMLDPVLADFRALFDGVVLHAPAIPYVSNVTGAWIEAAQATDPDHWVRHLRQAVRFAEGLELLLGEGGAAFLEVGPGRAFSGLLNGHPRRDAMLFAAPTLAAGGAGQHDRAVLLASLGQLWRHGVSPDWAAMHGTQSGPAARRRVPLPVYPFDRHRYWPQARSENKGGKPVFAAAAEAPAASASGAKAPRGSAPRNALELELMSIFAEVLGTETVAVDDSFFDLGGSSLSALNVVLLLEQRFGRQLPSAMLLEHPSVEALALALQQDGPAPASRVVALRAGGALAPLFVIHPYGGHATGYVELARRLGAAQPVYGIQARGLAGEAAPATRIEAMAAEYIALMKAKQPSGPYRLAGHSMGGCIAYEMAQQLRAGGEDVALLALLDARAQNASAQPLYRNGAYGQLAGKDWLHDEAVLLGILMPKLVFDWDTLRDAPSATHAARVLDAARGQGLLPPATTRQQQSQIDHLLAVTRANDEALRHYRPQAYEGAVLLCCGDAGFSVRFDEPRLGWDQLVAGALETLRVPGDHHSIMAGAGAAAIAAALQRRLAATS